MNLPLLKKEEIVPIDQLREPPILMNITTDPFIDSGVVGVRLTTLKSIMHTAGIAVLNVKMEEGESDSASTIVAGVNPDGSATGIGIKRKAKHRNAETSNGQQKKEINFVRGLIALNRQRIFSDIADESDGNLRDEKYWIKVLDEAIRMELLKISRKSLIRTTTRDKDISALIGLLAVIIVSMSKGPDAELMDYINTFLFTMGVPMAVIAGVLNKVRANLARKKYLGTEEGRKFLEQNNLQDAEHFIKSRFSFLNYYGYELANMLITETRLRTQRLLVQIEPSTEEMVDYPA